MSAPASPSSPRAQRGDPGAIALGLGALLLFISLFLHWYQPGRSAWTVFEVWDLVLAVLAAVAVVAALGRLGLAPARPDRWMVAPSIAAFVIVVVALLNHPPAAIGDGPMVGIWLALAATIVMIAGAATSLAQVSLVVEFAHRPRATHDRPPPGRPHLRRRRDGAPGPAGTGVEPPSFATEHAEPGPVPKRAPDEPPGPAVEPPSLATEHATPAGEADTAIHPVGPPDPDTEPTRINIRPPDDPEAPRPDPAPE